MIIKNLQEVINELFDIKSQTSAPIIISLGIFILGLIVNESVKGFSRANRRKICRKIFFQNIDNLIVQIKNQSRAYAKTADNLKFRSSENGGQLQIKRIELHQISIIKQIGYDNLFSAFFTGIKNTIFLKLREKKRIKAFNTIWSVIENAKVWQNINDDQNKALLNIINEVNSEREKTLHQYFEFFNPLFFHAAKDPEVQQSILGEYLLDVFKVRNTWQEHPQKTNPKIVNEMFVIPVMKIDDNYKLNLKEPITSSMLLQKSYSSFQEMDRLIGTLQKIHFDQSINYRGYAKLISTAKELLR